MWCKTLQGAMLPQGAVFTRGQYFGMVGYLEILCQIWCTAKRCSALTCLLAAGRRPPRYISRLRSWQSLSLHVPSINAYKYAFINTHADTLRAEHLA